MTPLPGALGGLALRAWRLELTRHASAWASAEGAFRFGGRWSSAGRRVLYTAIDPATGGPVVDQSGRTSRPDVFAAGNLLRGIETAGHCWAEGRAIACAMISADAPQGEIIVRPGRGLSYVMPQRLCPASNPALPDLHIRLDRPARGTLILTDATNRRIASLQIGSAPERRVALPLRQLSLQGVQGPLTLAMEES